MTPPLSKHCQFYPQLLNQLGSSNHSDVSAEDLDAEMIARKEIDACNISNDVDADVADTADADAADTEEAVEIMDTGRDAAEMEEDIVDAGC